MWGIVILVVGVAIFTRNAFKNEPIHRGEALLLPLYSLLMAVVSMVRDVPNWLVLVSTVVVAAIIAVIQATGARLTDTGTVDKAGRPIVMLRRNWQYLVGWVAIFTYGIFVALMSGEHVDILHEAMAETLKDLMPMRSFSSPSTWNIYLQTGVSSLLYTLLLIRKHPPVRAAIAGKRRTRQQ